MLAQVIAMAVATSVAAIVSFALRTITSKGMGKSLMRFLSHGVRPTGNAPSATTDGATSV